MNVVDTSDDASMDEAYVAYVDDEHVDNQYYDDNTDDDHDLWSFIGDQSMINRWYSYVIAMLYVGCFRDVLGMFSGCSRVDLGMF